MRMGGMGIRTRRDERGAPRNQSFSTLFSLKY